MPTHYQGIAMPIHYQGIAMPGFRIQYYFAVEYTYSQKWSTVRRHTSAEGLLKVAVSLAVLRWCMIWGRMLYEQTQYISVMQSVI